MKQNQFKLLRSAILCLALLATIPFAVLAQTEAVPGAEEVTLEVKGRFPGRGSFRFEGNTIEYRHNMGSKPSNVTINGTRWDDLEQPFQLGFVPDFLSPEIVERVNGGSIFLSYKMEKQFDLVVHTSSDDPRLSMVKLSMKKNARQDYTPEEKKEIVLCGTIPRKSIFFFEGNTVRYLHKSGEFPRDITINGKPWADLKEPFTLDFMPVSASVEIKDKQGRNYVQLRKEQGFFYLQIDNPRMMETPYQIKLISKPEKEDAASEAKEKAAPALDDSEVAVTLEVISGNGSFVFQGDKIYYIERNGTNSPEYVTVNGKAWSGGEDGEATLSMMHEPYSLGFTPDFESIRILERKGADSVKISRRDGRFDLVFDWKPSGTPYRSVTVAMKKNQKAASESQPAAGFPFSPAMMQMFAGDATTDGEMHRPPEDRFLSGLVGDRFPDRSDLAKMNQAEVMIEGVVDKSAFFFIDSNRIVYDDMSYVGEYPRGVTVNGKPWRNLRFQFPLDVTVVPETVSDMFITSDTLDYSVYQTSAHNRAVVSITNHGEPTKFKIRLVMLKKGGVDWRP